MRRIVMEGDLFRLLKSDKDALRELAAAVASETELRLSVINPC
mgnify:FL=1